MWQARAWRLVLLFSQPVMDVSFYVLRYIATYVCCHASIQQPKAHTLQMTSMDILMTCSTYQSAILQSAHRSGLWLVHRFNCEQPLRETTYQALHACMQQTLTAFKACRGDWNYLTVQLARTSEDEDGDPDLYGLFTGGTSGQVLGCWFPGSNLVRFHRLQSWPNCAMHAILMWGNIRLEIYFPLLRLRHAQILIFPAG